MSNLSLNKNIIFLDPLKHENKVKVFDIKSHPVENIFALVDLSGKLKILKVNHNETNINEIDNNLHPEFHFDLLKNYKISKTKESLYSLDFSPDGDKILTSSYDAELVIVDLNQNKIYKRLTKAHEDTINKVKFINENLFCSSGANGTVKIFDLKSNLKNEIFRFQEQSEEISDFEYNSEHNFLLSTSIDGTLAVYDIRKVGKYKLYALSDCIEDEFYCMKLIRHGQKVACGTSEGPIVLFNWDWFGDFKDRIMGHPGSVNCLEKYDENFLITGCEDGGVRFVSVSPKYIHSIISDKTKVNNKKEIFNDVTGLSLTNDKKFLAVISNINTVKIYNIQDVQISEKRCEEDENIEGNDIDENSKGESNNENFEDSESESEFEENEEVEESFEGEDEDDISNQENEEDVLEPEGEDNNLKNIFEQESINDSFSDSSLSKNKKKNKIDKSLKLQKKRNSDFLIEKERRKNFFSDM